MIYSLLGGRLKKTHTLTAKQSWSPLRVWIQLVITCGFWNNW